MTNFHPFSIFAHILFTGNWGLIGIFQGTHFICVLLFWPLPLPQVSWRHTGATAIGRRTRAGSFAIVWFQRGCLQHSTFIIFHRDLSGASGFCWALDFCRRWSTPVTTNLSPATTATGRGEIHVGPLSNWNGWCCCCHVSVRIIKTRGKVLDGLL